MASSQFTNGRQLATRSGGLNANVAGYGSPVESMCTSSAELTLLPVRAIALGFALLALAGCSAGPRRDAVASTATAFVSAQQGGDGTAACRLLTPDAEQSVSGATDTPCDKAIVSIDEKGTAVAGVQVWGDAAQVHIGNDVLFLRRISGTWRVSSAGCHPQPKGPYDCE